MTQVSGAMALLRGLIAQGIDTVFGLPGGQLDDSYDAVIHEQSRVRFVGSRHEQAAAYMAFGYARASGKPGAFAVVPGRVCSTPPRRCRTAYATQRAGAVHLRADPVQI